jgi:hypothetical protein
MTEYGTLPQPPELSTCLCGSGSRFYQCCKKHPDRRFLVQMLFGDGLEVFARASTDAKALAVVDAAEAYQMQKMVEEQVMGRVLIHDDPTRFLFVPKGVWSRELRGRFPLWVALERIGFHAMGHPAEAVKQPHMIAPPGPRGLALAMAAQGEYEVYTYLRLMESREAKQVLTANEIALELRIDFNEAIALLDDVAEKVRVANLTPDDQAEAIAPSIERNALLDLPDMDEATKNAGPPMSLSDALADGMPGDVRAGLDALLKDVGNAIEADGLTPTFESCNGAGLLEVTEADGAIALDFPPQPVPKNLDEDTEAAIASRTRALARELAFALYRQQVGLDAEIVRATVMDILSEYDSVAAELAEVEAVQGDGEVTVVLNVPPDSPLVDLMRAAARLLNEAGALDTPTIDEHVIVDWDAEVKDLAGQLGMAPLDLTNAVRYATTQLLRHEVEGLPLEAGHVAIALNLDPITAREVMRLAVLEVAAMEPGERNHLMGMIGSVLPCRDFTPHERSYAVVALLRHRAIGGMLAWKHLENVFGLRAFEASRLGVEAMAIADMLTVKRPDLYDEAMRFWATQPPTGSDTFLADLDEVVRAWVPEGAAHA